MRMMQARIVGIMAMALVFLGAGCVSFTGTSSKKAVTGPTGFYFSNDSGESWRSISVLPTAEGVKSLSNVSVYGLIEDQNDTKALYWLSRGRGLLYSYDSGETWKDSVSPLNTGFVYGIAIHPQDNCTLFATNGRQIFKTTDCNRSWKEVYREGVTSRSIKMLAINPFPPYQLYAMSESGVLLKSLDAGISWSIERQFKTTVLRLAFDKNKEGLLYVVTKDSGLLRSRDGGETWVSLKNKQKAFTGALQFRRLYLNPNQAEHIYWVSKYGVIVSKNGGEDWDAITLITPPGGAAIYSFAVNSKNAQEMYYTTTAGTRSTFYKTVDGGKSWVTRKLPSNQLPVVLRVHPENPTWLYMGFTALPPQ